MNINEVPKLISNSIIFRDEDGIFIYSQNLRQIAHVQKLNDYILQELKKRGFFAPIHAETTKHPVKRFSNLMLLLCRDCPMACRYCYADAGVKNAMMSREVADQAVSWYLATKPVNAKITFLGGGEPTLNSDVMKHLINKYGDNIRWILTTSGILSPSFLEWLCEHKVIINFSVDGPPDIQNKLRPLKNGRPSSTIVENSLRLWKEKGKPLSVRTTVTDQTVNKIYDILAYFEKLGVQTLQIEALYNLGRAIQEGSTLKQPPLNSWVEAVTTSLKWAKQKGKCIKIHGLIYFFQPELSASFCGPMSGNTIVVNHQGKLTACSEVVDDDNKEWQSFYLGELNHLPKIADEKLAYLASRSSFNMNSCKDCFVKYFCRGGCAYKGLTTTGELFRPDPRHCEFVKTIVPILIKRMALDEYK